MNVAFPLNKTPISDRNNATYYEKPEFRSKRDIACLLASSEFAVRIKHLTLVVGIGIRKAAEIVGWKIGGYDEYGTSLGE